MALRLASILLRPDSTALIARLRDSAITESGRLQSTFSQTMSRNGRDMDSPATVFAAWEPRLMMSAADPMISLTLDLLCLRMCNSVGC